MARILAIDLGTKRTGLAVTDPMQIVANPLETIPTEDLLNFLKKYFEKENVEDIVLGLPKNLQGESTEMTEKVYQLKEKLASLFPAKKIHLVDERFTSKIAMQSMISMGSKKKDRREKSGNLDKISATIILQSFLTQR
ncbi:Holliday junction resolvase RuvX [Algoriphagus kandeliae]|uniref:Putative pre-16S rRNA nuclease n=1 Tax=Algoriphagus kandeliae TaxID=2562278 RepID=A0A4Y9QN11_9BACT|nr:Holliday junction resolvase RuvX [Algoriphagus kandeliae]TFV92185.1 Holliday junction resolvase RuvX [Algoriphagus kandeliae]